MRISDWSSDVCSSDLLEEHCHAVAAEAEEDPLPQAENAAVAPAEHQSHGDEGVGQVLTHHVQAEAVEQQRKHQQEQRREDQQTDPALLSAEEFIECRVHALALTSFAIATKKLFIICAPWP